MRASSATAAALGLMAAVASVAAETIRSSNAKDFNNFEDNLAMESERQFMGIDFADFTSQFSTPDLRKLLAESGLFSEPDGFGQRMGSSRASSSLAGSSSSTGPLLADVSGGSSPLADGSTQRQKTNVSLAETRKSGGSLGGSVISQLLIGGKGVEDMHEELSGLLFGGKGEQQGGGCYQ